MPSPSASAALGPDAAPAPAAIVATGVASPRSGGWSDMCDPGTEPEDDGSHERYEEAGNGFADLSQKVSRLKGKATDLKKEYVRERFGNSTTVAEQSIVNAPSSIAPNWNLTGVTDNETLLSRCYENLARLFVLTNLTYIGESASESTGDFKDGFLELMQDAAVGLRTIMCNLGKKMANLISSETEEAINAISFPAVSSEAQRHSRDYYVLRVHEMSADNMTYIFDHFHNITSILNHFESAGGSS